MNSTDPFFDLMMPAHHTPPGLWRLRLQYSFRDIFDCVIFLAKRDVPGSVVL